MDVYLRESPRAVILVSRQARNENRRNALSLSTHAGIQGNTSSRAVIELLSTEDIHDLTSLKMLHARTFGCLGLINVGNDLFIGIITEAQNVGQIRPGEAVMKCTNIAFHSLNKASWDQNINFGQQNFGGPLDPQGPLPSFPHEAGYNSEASATPTTEIVEHPCTSMKKLLSNGTFYFARDGTFDLSLTLPTRAKGKKPIPQQSQTDNTRFVWNTYMMESLQEYRSRLDSDERISLDNLKILISLIQGYVGVNVLGSATIAVISRLSWKRAGTRFASRGIDDDGNVANFAESETLYSNENKTMSYCQLRGSVPLFWDQQGLQAFAARIQITRSRIASQPAFDKHFADLLDHYDRVHAINLLGTRDAETVLTNAYAEHMRNSDAEELYLSTQSKEDRELKDKEEDSIDRIGLTNFDFHSTNRALGGLDAVKSEFRKASAVKAKKDAFGFFIIENGNKIIQKQRGVFRVNCLDCLDRTNVVQDILSQDALQLCIDSGSILDIGAELWISHRTLWAENGDALSKIYTGTGALNTTFTRSGGGKKTFGGLVSDAMKSASRLYINNFQDKSKQTVIDALLGNMVNQKPVSVFDPVYDAVNAELTSRLDEFSSTKEISIFTGTWNLAGCSPTSESLEPFLFPTKTETDILAIGLQEVVPLTPSQILVTDPEKLRLWESIVSNTLDNRKNKTCRYIPLRSEQLVGTALILLIKEEILPHIRLVEASTKKTGLRGMSGNKGAVAIRLNIFDTNFCFITAHFAAGKSNVEERNSDYLTITSELSFPSGKTINDSHQIFWFGDFNYRIDGGNEIVRPLCEKGDLEELQKNDQLIKAMKAKQVFVGYSESMLVFLPTYKYDFHSQDYDSSEKFRVPAWTDRILYKSQVPFKSILRIYDRAELLTSDHRPVFAIFTSDARIYNNEKRNALRRELLVKYKSQKFNNGGVIPTNSEMASKDESDDEDDDDYDTDELPDPSNDQSAWWDKPLTDEEEHVEISNENANPFSRQRSIQYARQDLSKLNLSNATQTNSESASAKVRRQAPEPPKSKQKTTEDNSNSTTIQKKKAPPPPIPSKKPTSSTNINLIDVSPPKIPSRPNTISNNNTQPSLLDD